MLCLLSRIRTYTLCILKNVQIFSMYFIYSLFYLSLVDVRLKDCTTLPYPLKIYVGCLFTFQTSLHWFCQTIYLTYPNITIITLYTSTENQQDYWCLFHLNFFVEYLKNLNYILLLISDLSLPSFPLSINVFFLLNLPFS